MALIVLAGGRGARFGGDKAQLTLGGQRLLPLVLARLAFAGPVLIAAPRAAAFADLPARVVPDEDGGGPLAGLAAALAASPDRDNLVIACDLPFVSPALGRHLLATLAAGWDAAVPCPGGWPEPTCAAYRKDCLPAIRAQIASGRLKATGFHADVRLRRLEDVELAPYGPAELLFFNINTPDDLTRAERLRPEAERLGLWP